MEPYLQRLSVSDLLARMPADPWVEIDGRPELEPFGAEICRRVEERLLSDEDWRTVLVAGWWSGCIEMTLAKALENAERN